MLGSAEFISVNCPRLISLSIIIVQNLLVQMVNFLQVSMKLVTVKPVSDDHSWNHTKVVALDKWSSYKTPS